MRQPYVVVLLVEGDSQSSTPIRPPLDWEWGRLVSTECTVIAGQMVEEGSTLEVRVGDESVDIELEVETTIKVNGALL